MPLVAALLEIAVEFGKALLPGSLLFLMIGLTAGVILLLTGDGRRRTRAGAWLAGLAIFYWLLSLPILATGLETLLASGYRPMGSAAEAQGAQTVVVLTGGAVTLNGNAGTFDVLSTASAYRMLEAERVYRMLGDPLLILSGGSPGGPSGTPESEAMKAELVARGIPEASILLETESGDTHDQAVLLGEVLRERNIDSFVLVTSAEHMRRALGAFAAEGMAPVPSAAGPAAPGEASSGAAFLPSAEALGRSYQAIREGAALVYYALRGWLA